MSSAFDEVIDAVFFLGSMPRSVALSSVFDEVFEVTFSFGFGVLPPVFAHPGLFTLGGSAVCFLAAQAGLFLLGGSFACFFAASALAVSKSFLAFFLRLLPVFCSWKKWIW